MDILTEKGQQSLEQERGMLEIIKNKYNIDIIETAKDEAALCDGFIVQNGIITRVFESKCRNATLNDFRKWDSWLITYEKVDGLAWLSSKLCVPAIGFLYSVPDGIVLTWKITDEKGNYLFDFNVNKTKTQRSINGGEAMRENAYLPMKHATIL